MYGVYIATVILKYSIEPYLLDLYIVYSGMIPSSNPPMSNCQFFYQNSRDLHSKYTSG